MAKSSAPAVVESERMRRFRAWCVAVIREAGAEAQAVRREEKAS